MANSRSGVGNIENEQRSSEYHRTTESKGTSQDHRVALKELGSQPAEQALIKPQDNLRISKDSDRNQNTPNR